MLVLTTKAVHGAGNLTDGPDADLIYNLFTGEVILDGRDRPSGVVKDCTVISSVFAGGEFRSQSAVGVNVQDSQNADLIYNPFTGQTKVSHDLPSNSFEISTLGEIRTGSVTLPFDASNSDTVLETEINQLDDSKMGQPNSNKGYAHLTARNEMPSNS